MENERTPLERYHPDVSLGIFCCRRRRTRLFFLVTWLAYTQNNHTEIVLIKSLPGPLSLASYWVTLTSWFNPFLLISISPWGHGLLEKIQHVTPVAPRCFSDSAFFLLEFNSVFSVYLSSALSTRPRQLVSLFINGNYSTQRGLPHQLFIGPMPETRQRLGNLF